MKDAVASFILLKSLARQSCHGMQRPHHPFHENRDLTDLACAGAGPLSAWQILLNGVRGLSWYVWLAVGTSAAALLLVSVLCCWRNCKCCGPSTLRAAPAAAIQHEDAWMPAAASHQQQAVTNITNIYNLYGKACPTSFLPGPASCLPSVVSAPAYCTALHSTQCINPFHAVP